MKLLKTIMVVLLLASPAMAKSNYDICITKYTKIMTDLGKTLKPIKLERDGWFGLVHLENGVCKVKNEKVKNLTISGAKMVVDYRVTKHFQKPKTFSEKLSSTAKTIFWIIVAIWAFFAWLSESTRPAIARQNWINHWSNK
jgi:hypothetical protein